MGFYFNLKEDRNEVIEQIMQLENTIKIIDTLDDSPIAKFSTENILNNSPIKYNVRLRKERIPLKYINYYRSIFKWENTINQIDKVIKKIN